MADQIELVNMIDAALERFGSRDLVSGAEVLDFLLDLRLAIPGTPGRRSSSCSKRRVSPPASAVSSPATRRGTPG